MVANPYRFSTMGEVKEKCDVCGLDFKPEPGFYYGAMYVSYALGVAVFVTIWASCNWFFDNVEVWTQISLVLIALIGLGPYLYALSKVIWANFFFSYKNLFFIFTLTYLLFSNSTLTHLFFFDANSFYNSY